MQLFKLTPSETFVVYDNEHNAVRVLLPWRAGPQGLTCYYYGPRETVYEKLGHAEVVQLELNGSAEGARKQMEVFADVYFSQFKRTPFGMIR